MVMKEKKKWKRFQTGIKIDEVVWCSFVSF